MFILKNEKIHQYFEGFFPYYSAYLATTKTAAEMPQDLKLSTAIYCLREFIQFASAAYLKFCPASLVLQLAKNSVQFRFHAVRLR